MTVFEALDVFEALESKYSFVAGESVSTANVIFFLPKNDDTDTDKDDGNDVNCIPDNLFIGSVVEWLKHRTDDQHGLGSKPTRAILLCPWETLYGTCMVF